MAEQLGEAVLTVRADTTQLEAGLARAKQQTLGAGTSIGALQSRLQSLRDQYASVEIGSREFRKLQVEIRRTEQELAKVDKSLASTFAQRAGGFGSGLLGALGLGVGVGAGAAIGGFLKGSIDQAVALENATRKLQNTLGPQGAGGALNFAKGLSRDLGLNFRTLADSFGSFTAAASSANVPLETQKNLFAAVAKAGQQLGLSDDAVQGSFLALQQVASKGTVAMEELRGQLGERLPIALSATAKGLGISQQELIKLVESGKLTASQFFPALTKGLNDITAGGGGVETASQSFAKLRNAWEELQASFGTNLLPGVTAGVKELAKAIEGLGVGQQASALGFNVSPILGPDATAAQTVGALRSAAERYNLNQTQARNIFNQAVNAVNPRIYTPFGLSVNDDEVGRVIAAIDDKAKAFRARNPDKQAAAQAADAAAKAAEEQRKKREVERQQQLDVQLKDQLASGDLVGARDNLNAAKLRPRLTELQSLALQNQLSLNDKLRGIEANRLLLQRELAKPAGIGNGKDGTQSKAAIQELNAKILRGEIDAETVRAENRTKLLEAAKRVRDQLTDGAKQAALSLQSAADSLQGVLRGGFDLLTPRLQQEQIDRARASIQPLVDKGIIRTGIDISTPEKLFRVAGFAEQLVPAQQRLEEATRENAKAVMELVKKDWQVYISTPAQPTRLPIPAV